MVDQVYGEAWLMSMVKVKCQDHETGVGLFSGFGKLLGQGIRMFRLKVLIQVMGNCPVHSQDYSEARLASMVMVEGQAKGMC